MDSDRLRPSKNVEDHRGKKNPYYSKLQEQEADKRQKQAAEDTRYKTAITEARMAGDSYSSPSARRNADKRLQSEKESSKEPAAARAKKSHNEKIDTMYNKAVTKGNMAADSRRTPAANRARKSRDKVLYPTNQPQEVDDNYSANEGENQ